MITLTFQAATHDELLRAVCEYVQSVEALTNAAAPAPVREEGQQEHTAPAASVPAASAPAKRGRKSKSAAPVSGEQPATSPSPAQGGTQAPSPAAADPTLANVRIAMSVFIDKNGMKAAGDALERIAGTRRVAEVKPEHYADVIAAVS